MDEDKLIAVPESLLVGIGDAIRTKRDITTQIPVPDMAMQIGLIEGGSALDTIYDEEFEIESNYSSTDIIIALPKIINVEKIVNHYRICLPYSVELIELYEGPTTDYCVNRTGCFTWRSGALLWANATYGVNNNELNGAYGTRARSINMINGEISISTRQSSVAGRYRITILDDVFKHIGELNNA